MRDMSLPTRERGLKFQIHFHGTNTPLSLPTRERGLKSIERRIFLLMLSVAPYTGAWIEIVFTGVISLFSAVAPYTGAWIEIQTIMTGRYLFAGRSLHGSVD